MSARWLLLQLADGTFPAGGFAHSAGLEAATHFDRLGQRRGGPDDVDAFLDDLLMQTAEAALPFVREACERPEVFGELDVRFDAVVPLLAPNRASRAQGRALLGAVGRVWEDDERVRQVAEAARAGCAHHAPVFGALHGALGLGTDETMASYLHGVARGMLSAGVRLGLLGPIEAQRVLASRADAMSEWLELGKRRQSEEVAQVAPRIEVWAALHDRLEARLFQS